MPVSPGAGRSQAQDGHGLACSHSLVTHGSSRRPAIRTIEREFQTAGPFPNLRFVYVDAAPTLRSLVAWRACDATPLCRVAGSRALAARRLTRDQSFDLGWHLTFSNGWIGSTACLLNLPFVYGPVGGGVAPPWRLAGSLGVRGTLYEVARAGTRASGRYLNPLARASWRRATLILVQNAETETMAAQSTSDEGRGVPARSPGTTTGDQPASTTPSHALRGPSVAVEGRITCDSRP